MAGHKEHFYKYYNYAGLKASLENSARQWSHPRGLNDPLSPTVNVKWEFGGFQEIMVACVRKQENPMDKALGIDYQKFLDKMTLGTLDPETFVRDLKAAFNAELNALKPSVLLCCFTQNIHSLPMWTGYAANHTGGAIKFGNLEKTNSPLLDASKVIYQNDRPKCKLARAIEAKNDSYMHEVLKQTFLTKAQDWQYEDEWRVVYLENFMDMPEAIAANAEQLQMGRELLPFAKEEVTAVYLGAAMPEAQRSEIIELVGEKYPWAEIYRAVPQTKGLALDFECIQSWQRELPL